MKTVVLVACVVVLGIVVPLAGAAPDIISDSTITRLAFGSCNKHTLPQPLWNEVLAFHPEVWVWLGDVDYLDKHKGIPGVFESNSINHMAASYFEQKTQPEYHRFLDSGVTVLGTWDDHDYGLNDGDASYVDKKESQQLFLDFLGEHHHSPRRKREGVYASYVYGPPGNRVKIILLDLRYFQQWYGSEEMADDDLLGKAQWSWLEDELRNVEAADLTIIGSSLQFADTSKFIGEGWAFFPQSRKRLLDLIAHAPRSHRVIVLSGDVHYGEVARTHACKSLSDSSPQPIYEFTSSSMTHALMEKNGRFIPKPWRPLAMSIIGTVLARNPERIGHMIGENNFGSIVIDWANQTITVGLNTLEKVNDIETVLHFRDLEVSNAPIIDQITNCNATVHLVDLPRFRISATAVVFAVTLGLAFFLAICCLSTTVLPAMYAYRAKHHAD